MTSFIRLMQNLDWGFWVQFGCILSNALGTRAQTVKVARERFELSSSGPKPDMLDHYTNGLHATTLFGNALFNVRGTKKPQFHISLSTTHSRKLAEQSLQKRHTLKRHNNSQTNKQRQNRNQRHPNNRINRITIYGHAQKALLQNL